MEQLGAQQVGAGLAVVGHVVALQVVLVACQAECQVEEQHPLEWVGQLGKRHVAACLQAEEPSLQEASHAEHQAAAASLQVVGLQAELEQRVAVHQLEGEAAAVVVHWV